MSTTVSTSSSSTSSSASSYISGLISNIDTDTIVEKLVSAASKPKEQLESQKTTDETKLKEWQTINTDVLALKTKCSAISSAAEFQSKSAASSDESVLTAKATTSAANGTYYLTVTQVAQANQLASQTYTSSDANIGTGTFTVTFGDKSSFDVTVDSTNNTLSGLCSSINKANEGVTASIVNTGTNEYKLMLTSNNTGTDYAMTVSSTLSGGTAPTVDNVVQEAKDCKVTLGSGSGAISVTKSSNTISDLISGVTLNVSEADADSQVKLQISNDTSSVETAISDFVTQYNSLMTEIDNNFSYDSDSDTSGTLFGSYQLQSIQQDLQNMVSNTVTGVSSKYNTLAAIGISMGTDGQLSIDDDTLNSALSTNADDVSKLFATDMESDSSYISYVTSSTSTQASGTDGWNVNITQAATRAQVTASSAFSSPTSDESLIVNGTSIAISSGSTLDDVISAINNQSSTTNVTAIKTDADGNESSTGTYLALRSVGYGSDATVSVYSSSSSDTTGFGITKITQDDATYGKKGQDVEGTINGEKATGSGQILTADPDSSTSSIKGLVLKITATEPMSSKITLTKGIGASLTAELTSMTSSTGVIQTCEDSLNTEMDDLTDKIASETTSITNLQTRLTTAFTNMETALAKLEEQGNEITSIVDSWDNSSSSS